MTDSPPPQLARKRYSVDSNEDDSSDASLEIVSPVQKKKKAAFHHHHHKPTKTDEKSTTQPNRLLHLMASSDEDSDDDLLLRAQATFASKSNQASAKRSLSTISSTSSTTTVAATATSRTSKSSSAKRTISTASSSISASTSKESSASAREAARACKKRDTEERKRLEKLQKAQTREQEKLERQQKKADEQQTKKVKTKETQQAAGKFAHEEIVILMDSAIFTNAEYALTETLQEDFLLHEYPSALTCAKAVQWVRKDYLQGGAKEALQRLEDCDRDHYEHLPYCTLVLEPEDFIPLLQRTEHDEDNDYPALTTWLESLKSRWQHVWKTTKEPRIILMLHRIPEALDRQWIDHRRQTKNTDGPSPPTEWELQDAIQWLLVCYQVECIQSSTIESIQSNLEKLTRGLCEAPYANQVSELECVKKIKADCGDDRMSKARDTWLRQLQQMNGLSENMARNVIRHYPTLQSLWQAYQDGDDAENKALLAGILNEGKSRQVKLSNNVHRCLTSDNPKEMLL
jgi:hypothetical protein